MVTAFYRTGENTYASYDFTPYSPAFPGDAFDDYIYIAIENDSMELSNGGLSIIVGYHPIDSFGFCEYCEDVYWGETAHPDSIVNGINIADGESDYYRVEIVENHKYHFVESSGEFVPSVTDLYTRNPVTREMSFFKKASQLSESDVIPTPNDGFLYMVINNTFGSNIINGDFTLVSDHEFNEHGLCICEEYSGETIGIDEAASSFDLVEGEIVYIRTEIDALLGEEITVGLSSAHNPFSNDLVTLHYFKNGVWTLIEVPDDGWGTAYCEGYIIDSDIEADDGYLYIEIECPDSDHETTNINNFYVWLH